MTLKASELKVGDTYSERLVEDLKRTQIVQYAGSSGDYNPLHSDEMFTTQIAGYPSVFAHGMLTMGMTGRLLTNYVGDGRLTNYGVRFTNQVWPGDTLDSTATVEELREEGGEHFVDLTVSTVNQDGVVVVKGTASARIDPERDCIEWRDASNPPGFRAEELIKPGGLLAPRPRRWSFAIDRASRFSDCAFLMFPLLPDMRECV